MIRVRNTLAAKVVISPFANIAELTQNQGRVACIISSLANISRTGAGEGGDVALLWMGSCMCVVCICLRSILSYSKTCHKRSLKRKTKIVFQDRLSLNAGQKNCGMLQESIPQYFRPSLSYCKLHVATAESRVTFD